jgi:hypothetical protein
MPKTTRHEQPVPMAPEHRRVWRRLRPRCRCGLRWPCQDRELGRVAPDVPPRWDAEPTTALPQIGRELMTRGQAWRGNGGRW